MKEHNLDEQLQQSRPTIPINPVFVAKTMEHLEQTHRPRFTLRAFRWRLAGGLAVALLLVVGIVITTHTRRASNQIANQSTIDQQQTPKSQPPQSQDTVQNQGTPQNTNNSNNSANTRLASSLQSDVSSIDSQYSSLGTGDYSDTALSDSALYN